MKKFMRLFLTLTVVVLLAAVGTGCTAKAKKAYHQSRADKFYDRRPVMTARRSEYLNVLRSDNENAKHLAVWALFIFQQEDGRARRRFFSRQTTATNDLDCD